MEKLQKHLDAQAKEAVVQATEKMLKNKTTRSIVAEKVAETEEAVVQTTEKMLKNKKARDIVAEKVAANPKALAAALQADSKALAAALQADPKALAAALQNALASGKLAEFLSILSPEQKQQIKSLLG